MYSQIESKYYSIIVRFDCKKINSKTESLEATSDSFDSFTFEQSLFLKFETSQSEILLLEVLTLMRRIQSHLTRRSMVSTSCCQNLSCLQKCADYSVQRVKATGFSIEVCWFRRAMTQSHNRISRCVLISTCSESYTESSRETCADFGL